MSNLGYINPEDPIERREEKLKRMVDVLMRRVERDTDQSNPNYSHFQAAIVLEKQVKSRTKDLAEAMELLGDANAKLAIAKAEAEVARADLTNAIEAMQEGFALFDQTDKLILRNSKFCAYLPDVVDQLRPGVGFSDYVRIVSSSAFVVFEGDTCRADWVKRRLKAHRRKRCSFNVEHKDDRWIQVSEQKSQDNSTTILQTDVTDMVRLEREERDKLLGTQAAMIRATLDHLNQGIAIFDGNLALLGSNIRLREMLSPPQRLLQTGTRFSSVVDYFMSQKTFQEQSELVRLRDWVHETRSRAPFALRLTTTDETHFDVFCQETPERGFVISFTDVTAERSAINAMHSVNETLESRVHERTAELREARDLAERANTSKSRFVAAVSHDLLQPLNAAKLFLASLRETEQPEQARKLTDRIGRAFESVEDILGALLDISKLDSGTHSTDITAFAVDKLLGTLKNEFQGAAAAKNLELRILPMDAVVRSDHTYLLRIMRNLVANAIRYTDAGGVLVAARAKGADISLEVWDTGAGISVEDQGEIFKEFRRLHGAKATEPGMGLGLAIVERACAMLGHDLQFSSVEGRGSVFRVRVPRAVALRSETQMKAKAHKSGDKALTPMIALIVEDDVDAREGMTQILESWGVNTIEAESGEAALEILEEVGVVPDVAIVDLHLNGEKTGLDVISDLRRNFDHVPSVLVTADRDDELRSKAQEDDLFLLQKPLEPRRLRAVLTWLQRATR